MIDLIFDLQRFAGNNIAISLTGGGSYPSTSLGGSSNHINAGNGAHTVNVSLGGDSGFDYDYELWIDNFDTEKVRYGTTRTERRCLACQAV